MRASGGELREAGIDDGDVQRVDRALMPLNGQVVIAVVDGELVCRRLVRLGARVTLQSTGAAASAGPSQAVAALHAAVAPADGAPVEVWGVVTTVIKSLIG